MIKKAILIILIPLFLFSYDEVMEAVNHKFIKKECTEVYAGYLEFLKKTNESSGDIKIRWKQITIRYKREFLKCNYGHDYNKESFLKRNPLNTR